MGALDWFKRIGDKIHVSEMKTKHDIDERNRSTKRWSDRTNKKIDKVFTQDIPKAFKNTFTPTFGRKLAKGLTTVFGTTDRILSQVTKVGDKIFDIPVLGEVLKDVAPEIFLLNEGLKLADVGAKGLAGLTDLKNYKDQSGKEVVKNILERAQGTVIAASKEKFHGDFGRFKVG
jgi:hypothetical protein